MVRHGSAKPLSPSSNLGGASKEKSIPFGVLFSFLWMRYSRFELGSRRAKRKRTGSHIPLEALKACFQGAERGYLRRANTWWRLQTKEHCESSVLLFGTMCSACAERDAHFVRDVSFGNDVRFARE